MANTVNVKVGVKDNASTELERIKNKFANLQKQGAKGIGIGVAAGATTFALNAAARAVGEFTDVLGDSIKAAIEDERSQQKLGTSLKANVPAWNGNTKAIEDTLEARMKLGFSDDEQRDSLAKIVAATHDVNKALAVQRTAMDLARLKGISLAEAGDALIKVEGGQFRALKALGIQLPKNATAQDALNAVQKVAAGQAKDYAGTMSGKVLVAQVKVNEAMERLGYVIAPAAAAALSGLVDALEGVGSGLENMAEFVGKAGDGIKRGLIDPLADVANVLDGGGEKFDKFDEKADSAASGVQASSHRMMSHLRDDLGDVGGYFADTAEASDDATSDITDNFLTWREQAQATAQSLADDFFDPIETRYDILTAHRKLAADTAALAEADSATKIHDATNDIIDDLDDQSDALLKLGSQHKLTKADVDKFKKDTIAAYKAMGRTVPAQLQLVIDKMYELAGFTGGAVDINVKVKTGVQGHSAGKKRAAGGPVSPGGVYTVGENGPETLVMGNASGRVVSSGGGGGAAGGVSMPNITIQAAPGWTPGQSQAFAAAVAPAIVRYMQQHGILPRTASPLRG